VSVCVCVCGEDMSTEFSFHVSLQRMCTDVRTGTCERILFF
jgi:hypothetical protein